MDDKSIPQGSILGLLITTLYLNIYFPTEYSYAVHFYAAETILYDIIPTKSQPSRLQSTFHVIHISRVKGSFIILNKYKACSKLQKR